MTDHIKDGCTNLSQPWTGSGGRVVVSNGRIPPLRVNKIAKGTGRPEIGDVRPRHGPMAVTSVLVARTLDRPPKRGSPTVAAHGFPNSV